MIIPVNIQNKISSIYVKKSLVLIKSSVKHPGKINTPVELITYVDETVVEDAPVETAEEVAEETNEESSQDAEVAE